MHMILIIFNDDLLLLINIKTGLLCRGRLPQNDAQAPLVLFIICAVTRTNSLTGPITATYRLILLHTNS